MRGRRGVDTIRLAAPHLDADEVIAELEADELAHAHEVRAFVGVATMLTHLPPERWGVVTSSSRESARACLQHLRLRARHGQ
jgi:mannitol-1-/sugar-/sorbitol-6-phosphatase